MTTRKVYFIIRIYTPYGEFLATAKHNGSTPSYDAVRVGSMDNNVYPALDEMTFHGDFAVAHFAKPIAGQVCE